MRICIVEDDLSVISILEDIVEREGLGTLCGDMEGGADLEQILALDPDIVLIDLLMPGKDGLQVVRELRERGSEARFIMISQVSAKEMIAKAYTAGVSFFIQKPINFIEVCNVIRTVSTQIENERALKAIRSVFASREAAPLPQQDRHERQRRRIKYILSQLGMAGEKGSRDIQEMCLYLIEEGQTASQIGVSTLCARLSESPRTMEQRARRAVEKGMSHIASLGVEDYNNELFHHYAARLFSFPEVRREMSYHQGKGAGGKVNLKIFLDGLLILIEEE
ncbi:MAG: response regulator [Oscillibacter sp.]|nr:response regulator [Oscillibacter sp.]